MEYKMKKTKKGNPNWYRGMQSANPYGRNGKPSFMLLVGKGLENFLSSPFNK
jgi:hypothetical protein